MFGFVKGFVWEYRDNSGSLSTTVVSMGILRSALRRMARNGKAFATLTFPGGSEVQCVRIFYHETQMYEAFFRYLDEQGEEQSLRLVSAHPDSLAKALKESLRTRRLHTLNEWTPEGQSAEEPEPFAQAPRSGEVGPLPEEFFRAADESDATETVRCLDGRLLDIVQFRNWFAQRKIYGIKVLRELTGLDLKDTKDLFDGHPEEE